MKFILVCAALSFVVRMASARAEELCIGPACVGEHRDRDRDEGREERREHRDRDEGREERREHRDRDEGREERREHRDEGPRARVAYPVDLGSSRCSVS